MSHWIYDRKRVDAALRKSGVVGVLNRSHVKNAKHFVDTMWEVYCAGFISECTFQIDPGIIGEGMQEITKRRAESPADKPFIVAAGSILNPKELEMAMEMGFDMIVSPANMVGGYMPSIELVKITHSDNRFCIPAISTPTELCYYIERGDGNEPDAVKVFPAGAHGPKGIGDLLAPFIRERHKDRLIIPAGAVNYTNGPDFVKAISSRGFFPVLGMSAPLQLVADRKAPGDIDVIRESLETFKRKLEESKAGQAGK